MRRITIGLLALLLLAGCGAADVDQQASGSPAAPSPSLDPTDEPEQTPTMADTPQLTGAWETTLGAVPVTLTLDTEAGTYRIVRGGNSGAGEIAVDGDRIEFFGSNLCSGAGAYTWSISGPSLRFEPIDSDPCSGRVDVLVDLVYGNYTAP